MRDELEVNEQILRYDTDFEVGQDNIEVMGLDVHNPVFFISGFVVVAFVAFSLLFPQISASLFQGMRDRVTSDFDWLFIVAGNAFVLFVLYLIVSPLGAIRLGGRDATPDFSRPAWLAMLFAAGMGIGLMFFGVFEPVAHFQKPPLNVMPENTEAAQSVAMAATIYHWGLHPWAIYAAVGLSMAFFGFNRQMPLTIRSVFYPLLGDAVWRWPGHIIDTLAVFATLFGLATSLGFGAEQALAGMNYLFDVPVTNVTKILLIALITAVATLSVVAGLDAGVKRLSAINMYLALALLVFVIAAGPTLELVSNFLSNTVNYVWYLPAFSNPIERNPEFLHGWTTFYWAWWISWSPFVGMFIARISRGRTVREFLLFVLVAPTLIAIVWMTAFGGTALHQIQAENYMGVAATVESWKPELSLFRLLEALPLSGVTSVLGVFLVLVFFITSCDSGSLVIDTITAGGKLDPPTVQRVFWAVLVGMVAVALLLGGGLRTLQAAAVATGFPFTFVLLAMCICVYRGLREEAKFLQEPQY